MTEFITRNHGHSCFEVLFKTTDPEHYKAIQDFARRLIDHQKPVTDNNVGCKWIPVAEGFPRAEYGESENVLTYNEFGTMRVLYFDGSCWCYPSGEVYDKPFKVTHWMPLPESPKEAAK
jgi:hypothetical protein